MIKNVLSSIGGVEHFGIISICLFFAFFIGTIAWVFCQKRSHLDAMSALPLQPEEDFLRSRVSERHPVTVERSVPLTPALSPGERENRPPSFAQTRDRACQAGVRPTRAWGRLFSLPEGEGQGEGNKNFALAPARSVIPLANQSPDPTDSHE